MGKITMAKIANSLKTAIIVLVFVVIISIFFGILLWTTTPNTGDMSKLDPSTASLAVARANIASENNLRSWGMLGSFTEYFMKPGGKWIMFVIFAILIFLFIMGAISISSIVKKTRRSSAYKGKKSSKGGFVAKMKNSLASISNPLGRRAYNPIVRTVEKNGRCDNINWISVEDKKRKVSLCFDTSFKQPEPVRFIIDPTKLYEYDRLPNAIKQKLRTDSDKLSITVPYTYNDKPSAYVLNFKDAVFEDGTPARDLFDQRFNYDYWMFQPKNLTSVGPTKQNYRYTYKYREPANSPEYQGIDVYK